MDARPPVSVILPTVRPTSVIDELAEQLGADDELLIVCDQPTDPVAIDYGVESADEIAVRNESSETAENDDSAEIDETVSTASLPASTRLVFAGDPTGCSGKANAIAAGMAAATADRLVWTDDDFHHPPGWLDKLAREYDTQGPTTEVPFFVGRDPLSTVLEPLYALGATAGLTLFDKPWAGAVVFERSDLDEERFRRELRRTVSDDGLLSLHTDVTPVRRVRQVPVGGTVGESLERHVRFMQIVWRFVPHRWVIVPLSAVFFVCCLVAPVAAAIVSTLWVGGVYAYFGVRRPTVLLAFPALVAQFPLLLHGLVRRQFVWAGRRYRWRRRFSVTVEDDN